MFKLNDFLHIIGRQSLEARIEKKEGKKVKNFEIEEELRKTRRQEM